MIQHITIKNFKSIKSAETRLPEHVSAIVGLNSVGKTNLIQSINFARNLAKRIISRNIFLVNSFRFRK
jgi:AAA15 family ATPase/GTPase